MAKIQRIGVIKMALFMGLYGAAMGLIFGLFITLFSFIGISAITSPEFGFLGFLIGAGAIIFLPIFYGGFMFVLALIFTPIMNLILKIINGLDLDLDMSVPAE